jgi:hypothetical protein
MSINQFTIEVFKQDKRITSRSNSVRWGKNKPGLRFVAVTDHEGKSKEELEEYCKSHYPTSKKFVTYIRETYVTRKHLMTGEEFRERYDTPSYCSPSSESYFCM